MQKKLLKSFVITALGSGIVFFSSCGGCGGGDTKTAFSNFHPEKEIEKYIDGYYSASLGESSNPKSGKSSVYIDFSDGLVQAYTKNPQNVQIIQAITNSISSPEMEWFALGNDSISKLPNDLPVLYKKLSDANQYKDIMAPIKRTLEKITNENNDALLVTDFEEYRSDSTEDFSAYAKQSFINWLKKGNSITFFYTDGYEEINNKSNIKSMKKLYYTVFTQGRSNENSMISKVRDALKEFNSIKEFTLNNNPYSVTNEYGGKDSTGLQNKQSKNWKNFNSNACLDKKLPYEVIGINKEWDEDVDTRVKNIIGQENGIFLDKLYLNASDQSSYKLNKVAVKVYDATEDYKHFAACEEAKNHQPKMTKNKSKIDVWSKESKNDPIITTCYIEDQTDLKKEWIYDPNGANTLKTWDEVFSYDERIFSDHLRISPEKVELITNFHKNYNLKNIKNNTALLRIDYVIEDATFNSDNTQLNDFHWNSTTQKGTTNNSLAQAIKISLQESSVSPKGKILYSYYIKLANSTKSE
jgi:hypothetical protein